MILSRTTFAHLQLDEILELISHSFLANNLMGGFPYYGKRIRCMSFNNGSCLYDEQSGRVFELRLFPSNVKPAGLLWVDPEFEVAQGKSLHGKLPEALHPQQVFSLVTMLHLLPIIFSDKDAEYDEGLLYDIEFFLDRDLIDYMTAEAAKEGIPFEEMINQSLKEMIAMRKATNES